MVETEIELKRWVILNSKVNKLYNITDREFKALLDNKTIKLRGQDVIFNNNKVWIDAIFK